VRFSTDRWWQDGDSWGTATDVAVSAGQPARLDAALVPPMTTVWGETFWSGGPQPDVRVDVFHADTGALVATTFSFDGTGTPRGCIGCYDLELPAGDIYTSALGSAGRRPPGSGGMAGPLAASESSWLRASRRSASSSRRSRCSPDASWIPVAARSRAPRCTRSRAAIRCPPKPPEGTTTGTDGAFRLEVSNPGATGCSSSDPTEPGRLPAW
jgi:hypothetical protein